jgi:Fe-S-cluster containining protein
VLPLARKLADAVSRASAHDAESRGEQVRCGPRCASCCRPVIPVAPMEAVALARLVKSMPPKRREAIKRRFDAGLRRLEEVGLIEHGVRGRSALRAEREGTMSAWEVASLRYFRAGIPCPFLENESCGIYADRPVVCREYLVTSAPEHCSDPTSPEVATVARPIYMNEVLSDVASEVADVPPRSIPLILALEWTEAHGDALDVEVDGEALARRVLDRAMEGA